MKKLQILLLSIIMLAPSCLLADNQEVGKYPKMFKSGDYTITILRLGKEEDKTVLIKVDGIDNEFDGQIFKHETKCDNTNCTSYKLETKEIPGKEKWWTIQSSRSWGSYDNLVFYPPGIDKKSEIYEIKRPEQFDSNKFYKEYLGQKALIQ